MPLLIYCGGDILFQRPEYLCSPSVTSDSWYQNIWDANQKASMWTWNQTPNLRRFGWIFRSGRVKPCQSSPPYTYYLPGRYHTYVCQIVCLSFLENECCILESLYLSYRSSFSVPTAFLSDRVNIIDYNHIKICLFRIIPWSFRGKLWKFQVDQDLKSSCWTSSY